MASVLTRTLQVSFAAGDIERAFDEDDSNATIPVTPAEAATNTVSVPATPLANRGRSEEHTSELQSLMRSSYAVFCLKKKNKSHKKQHRATENPQHKQYQ